MLQLQGPIRQTLSYSAYHVTLSIGLSHSLSFRPANGRHVQARQLIEAVQVLPAQLLSYNSLQGMLRAHQRSLPAP